MANSPESPHAASWNLKTPIALDSRNFTSLSRTPWAGTSLASGIKRRLAITPTQKIGESWEISCDPDMPSRLAKAPDLTLAELIKTRPIECLGSSLTASGRTTCDILVKLLNADSPLSLQIHPSDENPALTAQECGKPESWLVLSAEPGSGFYLGFSENIAIETLRSMLESGTFSSDYLQFVPVKAGDYFEIEPHVPHAIGPGVVLLEPQRIYAGKSGKTWRLWDWDRKYNQAGDLDMAAGQPRSLNIKESMPLLNPASQWGTPYVDGLRRHPEKLLPRPGAHVNLFPANQWYQTISLQLRAGSHVILTSEANYACASVIHGKIDTRGPTGDRAIMNQGESFFIPHASLPIELAASDEDSHVTLVIPAGQGVPTSRGSVIK